MWHRNVSTCFIPAYYVLTLSLNVTIGEIIDYILMRAISSWWNYNLGAILSNLLKLFFFGRASGGGEHISNIIMHSVEKVISMHMFWKGKHTGYIYILKLFKTILCLCSSSRWFHVDIVLQLYPTNRLSEPCTTMTPGLMMTWALKRETFYIYLMTGIHLLQLSLSCKIYTDIHSSTQHFFCFFSAKFGSGLNIDCRFNKNRYPVIFIDVQIFSLLVI